MREQHRQPDHFARPILQQIAYRDEVAERLRHLLALDLKKAVVHPVIRHDWRVEGAARLRNLVFMMREYEIDAAAMDVEYFAEVLPRHGRAFDVPARPAWSLDAGRRWPRRLAGLRGLPQHEIHRRALIRRDLDARPGDHLVERASRQFAVIRHRSDAEQNVVLLDISVSGVDQPLDQRAHLPDVLGRTRLDRRRKAAERGDIFVELP